MRHNLILMKWGWRTWMFLCFMVSGTFSLVTIHQPPVLTAPLGGDVIMQCHLSHDEKMVTTPVLYWERITENKENPRLWRPSEKYKGRVELLDQGLNSSNKSILLKNVQWEDNGRYLCKMSITTEKNTSHRMKGSETLLVVYDTMTFTLTSHNNSLLRCEVNVSWELGLALSIFHDGCKPQTVNSLPGDAVAAPPYVTLSETVSLRGGGKYECQLHLNEHLLTQSIFHFPPADGEGGDAEKNVLTAHPTMGPEPNVTVCPEPWVLYGGLLLVPTIILLCLVTALLISRC